MMVIPTYILRSLFSLLMLITFLLGGLAGNCLTALKAKTSVWEKKSDGSAQKETVVKQSVSSEAVISSAVSIKFLQPFADFFVRQYVLLINTATITDFGYPVFRDTYFANIFSHFIVINAP